MAGCPDVDIRLAFFGTLVAYPEAWHAEESEVAEAPRRRRCLCRCWSCSRRHGLIVLEVVVRLHPGRGPGSCRRGRLLFPRRRRRL
eukprot:2086635-Pyramimonas_sp.AAC.1